MPGGGGDRDRYKLIFARRRPAGEGQTSSRSQGRAKVVERGVGIVEEHDSEPREDEIKTCCGKKKGLRVRFVETDVP